MTKIGFIARIAKDKTFCFLAVPDGTEFFAHKRDFTDVRLMKRGQWVEFTVVEHGVEGKKPGARSIAACDQQKVSAGVA